MAPSAGRIGSTATIVSPGRGQLAFVLLINLFDSDSAGGNARIHVCSAEVSEFVSTLSDGPGQILCWDITYLPAAVRGKFYYLYVFLDIWSRKIVGRGVHEEQCGTFAAQLLEPTCDSLGTCAVGASLHADNGGPMRGSTMLSTMQWLGIVPSFSRPNVSDDNPFVESIFRTLKYRPVTPARFASLEDAAAAVGILLRRRAVYRHANKRNPDRWTGMARAGA